ncbi:hypothetical protein [Aeromonas sp. S16(2024)]|uniref:hypothetical protein n=1 Tax=Aeromonas sp. S16(2024) TaxID=3242889 RepID=UPI00352936DD
MNKVIYVKAKFKPIGEEVTVKVSTGEITKGFFGGEKEVTVKKKEWQQTGWSDHEIDGECLSNDISTAVEKLNREGYEVIAIQPITSGAYNYKVGKFSAHMNTADTCYSYGYGYSYTEGVTIIAKKISSVAV